MDAALPSLTFHSFSRLIVASAIVGVVGATLHVSAQTPPSVPPDNPALVESQVSSAGLINSMDALNDDRKLSVGDRISYRVIEEQKDPVSLTITDSGELPVPLLGLIPAAGKTCKQLALELKPILQKDYFYNATVIIGLDTQSTRSLGKVYIMGQVHSQGAIELPPNEPLTVSQAVLLNGGLADFADTKRVRLTRKGSDGKPVITVVDVGAVYKGRSDKDPILQPGDTVNVPERLINF